ncbi:hypothetical protein [Reichenbachiella sp.]|uniref:hypothetical protein n=1 Tax=Reichenbachiella sp. TaxID=2184521 RepID=UPI003298C452
MRDSLKKINGLVLMIFLAMLVLACEERVTSEYTEYVVPVLSADSPVITYNDLEIYPSLQTIYLDTPTFDLTGQYRFVKDSVKVPEGGSFDLSNFSVNGETGVVAYNNSDTSLSVGVYPISIAVQTASGSVSYEDLFTVSVLDVPVTLTVDQASVDVNGLQIGDIATVSYSDTSTDGLVSSIIYMLSESNDTYSINATSGVISKVGVDNEGSTVLSVIARTNLGIVTASDLLTVNVGASPTIEVFQQDGGTPLSKVTLSPWSSYTSHAPTLTNMIATSWEVILPESLNSFSSSITTNATGQVIVAADAGLPEGDHLIGLKGTNAADISVDFDNLFTLRVESQWDTGSPVFTENFDGVPSQIALNTANASLSTYMLNGSVKNFHATNIAAKGGVKVMRVFTQSTPDVVDAAAVLSLSLDPSWKKARVSFTEGFGFSDFTGQSYENTLSSSHSNVGLSGGTYDSHWNLVMAADDPAWTATSIWNSMTQDSDLNPIPFQEIDITAGESNLYLMWRVVRISSASLNAQIWFDAIRVEVSTAYAAIEE